MAKNTVDNTQDTNKSNIIQKPLSVAKSELMQKLVDDINNSGLPMVVLEYVVRDLYNDVMVTAREQYKKDMENYESSNAKV